jgi:hypothetical protein
MGLVRGVFGVGTARWPWSSSRLRHSRGVGHTRTLGPLPTPGRREVTSLPSSGVSTPVSPNPRATGRQPCHLTWARLCSDARPHPSRAAWMQRAVEPHDAEPRQAGMLLRAASPLAPAPAMAAGLERFHGRACRCLDGSASQRWSIPGRTGPHRGTRLGVSNGNGAFTSSTVSAAPLVAARTPPVAGAGGERG